MGTYEWKTYLKLFQANFETITICDGKKKQMFFWKSLLLKARRTGAISQSSSSAVYKLKIIVFKMLRTHFGTRYS